MLLEHLKLVVTMLLVVLMPRRLLLLHPDLLQPGHDLAGAGVQLLGVAGGKTDEVVFAGLEMRIKRI